jgi:hypothetical protein
MWFNSSIHFSFFPITGAAFCVALSFTLVLSLEYATGPIKLKLGTIDFEGASGPIILWCLCFSVMSFGLYLLGLPEVAKAIIEADHRSLLQLFSGRCT